VLLHPRLPTNALLAPPHSDSLCGSSTPTQSCSLRTIEGFDKRLSAGALRSVLSVAPSMQRHTPRPCIRCGKWSVRLRPWICYGWGCVGPCDVGQLCAQGVWHMRPAVRAVPCALCRPSLPWRGRCALHSCFWKATAHGIVSIRRTLLQMARLPKKAHRDWTQRALYSAAPAVLSMRAHRFVRMAWQHAASVRARATAVASLAGPSCW
jgi:hypothetical protein